MKEDIIQYFSEKEFLSARNISKHLNIKKKRVSRLLNTSPEFVRTSYNDTGCGKTHTNTFKLVN